MWWSVAKSCSILLVLVIRCPKLLEGIQTIWICCLYVFYYYYILSHFLGSLFNNGFKVASLFNTLIYVFYFYICVFLFYIYVSSSASCHSSANLPEVFPWFFLRYKANARLNRKDGAWPAHFQTFFVVLYIVCFVTFCVLCVLKCVL